MGSNLALVTPDIEEEVSQYQQEVSRLEQQSQALVITDDASEEAGLMFIAEVKGVHARMEAWRTAKVKPLNDEVKGINNSVKPFTDVLDRLWRVTDHLISAHITKKRLAIAEANRKAIAIAEQIKREEAQKAEVARAEADRLRKEAERVAMEDAEREYQAEMARLAVEKKQKEAEQAVKDAVGAKAIREAKALEAKAQAEEEALTKQTEEARRVADEEKARLEKAAAKLDLTAEKAEDKAMVTAPVLVGSASMGGMRTLADGAKVGTRKTVDWCFTNGLPKEGEYLRDDERFKGIPDRYFVLDASKLGKDVKNGNPVEGCLKTDGFATTGRR